MSEEQSLQAEAPAPELAAVTEAINGGDEAQSEPSKDVKQDDTQDDSTQDESSAEQPKEEKPEPTEADRIREAMQKRIDRKTAVTKALEKKIAELQSKVAEIPQQEVDNSPKEEDFETFEEYDKARVEYLADKKAEERFNEKKQKELAQKSYELRQAKAKEFNDKIESFRAEVPDYDEKAAAFMELTADYRSRMGEANPTLQSIGNVILELENAPAVIHQLGANPDLMDDLASMNPVQAGIELVRLHESYSRPEKKQITPEPIKPLKATGKGNKDPRKMSDEEYIRWRNKQKRR